MKRKWTTLKQIIGAYEEQKNVFLTLMNEEGRIVCVNANMKKTMHLKNPRKKSTSFFDFLHPAHFDSFKTAIRQSAECKKPAGMELYLKNGYYHPMKWQINYLGDEFRTPTYLCVGHMMVVNKTIELRDNSNKVNDLSTRLQEKEALFNQFMKHTPNLFWVVDDASTLVFANTTFYKFFSLDPAAATGQKLIHIIPSRAYKSLFGKHLQVFETNETGEFIEKAEWADGTNNVFRISLFPIQVNGSKKMIGGTAISLNDKYEAEKKLKQLNERLLLLTGASNDAIWEWDMQTGQIFRNDTLMNMIGYSNEAPRGLSWWLRRIHPEDRNRVSDKVRDTTEQNLQSWQDNYRFKCADGHYKYMQDKGYVVYENELPVKMIGSLQDVTGLKELEDQLVEEKMQRQKEISETVIKVQEKERTRIGHELHDNVNQILSTVKLFIDMIHPSKKEEKQFKEKTQEYLMMAIEEIRKLSKELVVPQLTHKGLVDSIFTLAEDMQMATGMRIRFTHDHDTELLSPGKKITLFRIVQEQLKNIIKHSRAKEVDIYLQRKENITQLVIRDNGIGFDSGQTHRGIGLSNIYERTRFYNGTVDIETTPGKGCILKVTIAGL
jgi:PAS domain S-box-containing protein